MSLLYTARLTLVYRRSHLCPPDNFSHLCTEEVAHFDEKLTTLQTKLGVAKTVDERIDDTVDDGEEAGEEVQVQGPGAETNIDILQFGNPGNRSTWDNHDSLLRLDDYNNYLSTKSIDLIIDRCPGVKLNNDDQLSDRM